jgi:hypothetical protein
MLNFLILILCVVVFGLMLRLLKTEYFNSVQMNNVIDNTNDSTDLKCDCQCSYNDSSNMDINELNNLDENNVKKIRDMIDNNTAFEIIIPDNSPPPINLNNSHETTAVVENGVVKVSKKVFEGDLNNMAEINNNRITEMVALNTSENSNTTDRVLEEDPFAKQSMINKVRNFLEFPDMQQFCPNIDNSESSFWAQMPEDFAGDIHVKFCCTSCFYLVSEEIYCGENMNGKYKLDNFSVTDINLLKEQYNKSSEMKNKFTFPEVKLGSLLGKSVLKYKYNDEYYTIQVVKSLQDLYLHEPEPTILKDLYTRHYKCPVVATKPIMQILNY